MTTIQVRIDKRTKRDSAKILEKIGLDLSAAIKVYLKQIVISEGIPFPIVTSNGLTIQQEAEILKASDETKRGKNLSPAFKTAKEAIAYLHAKK